MIIYELYGCPGSGKSTLARTVIERLREKGIGCASYRDIYFSGNPGKINKLKIFLATAGDYELSGLKKEIQRLCRWSGEDRKYGRYLLTLCHQIRKAQKERKEKTALLDEGIIQFISSLSHGRDITGYPGLEQLADQIRACGIQIETVFCDLPIGENVRRIRARGEAKHTRFLDIKEDRELEAALEMRKKNLSMISGLFSQVCTLDMSEDVQKNATVLAERMTQT